ncbi:MAG: cell division protein FtsQ/DivIB [Anaerolineae bacterium]
MAKSQRRRRKKKRRFETAGTLVLGRVGQAQQSSRSLLRRLRGVLLVLLIVVVAGALWLTLDDRFYIYHAEVVGTVRVSPDEVLRASGLLGLHILWVRSAEVEARVLAALPSLESARVICGLRPPTSSAGLLAECTIAVVERRPRMVWNDDGQLWWIDADGVIFPVPPSFPPIGGEEVGEGWLVRGPLPRDEDGRLHEPVRIALAELWAVGADMSPLLYVPDRGLVFTDQRGWRVIVGQGPGMAERWRVLEWLTTDLEARGLTPRFVDVRFSDAPYYSLTSDW